MEITSVRIEGYRSIADITIGPFARATVLAGRNSAGKSNVLVALRLVTDPETVAPTLSDGDFYPSSSVVRVSLNIVISREENDVLDAELKDKKDGLSKPLSDFTKDYYLELFYQMSIPKHSPSKHPTYLAYKKVTKYYPLFGKGASTPLNVAVLQSFRKLLREHYRLLRVRDSYGSITADEQNQISALAMKQFVSTDPVQRARYNEIRDALLYVTEGIGGEIQPAELPAGPGANGSQRFQMRSEVERSYYLPLPNMGDGAQRVALILHHIVNSPQGILAIEEPEASLHPGAQKRFRKTLDRLCSKYQKRLLLTTHSPIFLHGWQAAAVFRVEISKGRTVLTEAAGREEAIEVARALGVDPGDSFVTDGIVWVEGPSDVDVYGAFFRTLGEDMEAKNVGLMWGGGDAMQHVHAADLRRLNPNFAVLLDSDRTSGRKEIPPWKQRLAKECVEQRAYSFVTERRAVENYFSLRAVREYYGKPDLPPFAPYEDFATHISAHAAGCGYAKKRDAGRIAASMTAKEVESLGDLTQALREVRQLMSRWKGSD